MVDKLFRNEKDVNLRLNGVQIARDLPLVDIITALDHFEHMF